MDDVVAVRLELADGGERYFVTWGWIQDPIDPEPLAQLVMEHSRTVQLGAEPASARVCSSLREAAESASAPYFFESFFWFASRPILYGDAYRHWRDERSAAMAAGQEISYCGRPGS